MTVISIHQKLFGVNMASLSEVKADIDNTENDLIALKKLELTGLQNLYSIINSDSWNEINFNLMLKKEDAQKITQFDFKSCMDEKIIEAMKKLIKVGVENSIKQRKESLKQLEQLIK